MALAHLLIAKRKKITSKYHKAKETIKSTYGAIEEKGVSKYHRIEAKNILRRETFNNLIEKSASPYLAKIITNKYKKNLFQISLNLTKYFLSRKNIDWTRGRFKGELVQVIIKQGLIIEKVFLTPKGGLIIVKRSELGLLIS